MNRHFVKALTFQPALMDNNTMDETRRFYEAGWTYVETIIVVTIIVILTSAVGLTGMRYVEKARVSTTANEIAVLSLALDSYYLDCGSYPTEEQSLEALWSVPVISPVPSKWDGPYITKKDFTDPWGNAYHYRIPGPNGLSYEIFSFGSDGQEGGEGTDADIFSWEE